MEWIALLVDDVAHARQRLLLLAPIHADAQWVIVACPPARIRHIGRWSSRSARVQWVRRWAEDLKSQLDPLLGADAGSRVEHLLADGSPEEVVARLDARYPGIRIVDTRRSPAAPMPAAALSVIRGWTASLWLASGLGMVLGLID